MAIVSPGVMIDDAQVSAAGTVVSRGNRTITFFPLGSNPNYKVEVVFQNIADKEPNINSTVVENYFRITLTNVVGNFGSGNSEPIYVANENGRKILLDFVTIVIGQGDVANRLFHFTFFDGGPVNG